MSSRKKRKIMNPKSRFYCNDCKKKFRSRILANRNNNAVQHYCSLYSKIITRKVNLHSNKCKGDHGMGPCVVKRTYNDPNSDGQDETKDARYADKRKKRQSTRKSCSVYDGYYNNVYIPPNYNHNSNRSTHRDIMHSRINNVPPLPPPLEENIICEKPHNIHKSHKAHIDSNSSQSERNRKRKNNCEVVNLIDSDDEIVSPPKKKRKINKNKNEINIKCEKNIKEENMKEEYNNNNIMGKHYTKWTAEDIICWLTELENGKFKKYSNLLGKFQEEEVCGKDLMKITQDHLKGWGVKKFSDKVDIYNHIQNLV
eukprot:460614_1